MKISKNDLTVVQNLYLLQVDLLRFLESDLSDPVERKEARKQVKEFTDLLKRADWRYMGGEDVMDNLKQLQEVLAQKVSRRPATGSVRRMAVAPKPKTVLKKKMTLKSAKKITTKTVATKSSISNAARRKVKK